MAPAASEDTQECQQLLAVFLRVCKLLGIPVAMDKVDGPATTIVFLGLELDSVLQQVRLPSDKLAAILKELEEWQQRTKVTKRQLLSLVGCYPLLQGQCQRVDCSPNV